MSDVTTAAGFVSLADRAVATGDMTTAARFLFDATRCPDADIDTWLKCAAVRRAIGDVAEARAAIQGALRLDPLHFLALMMQASLAEGGGDPEAGEYYGRALAQRPEGALPHHIDRQVKHAEAVYRRYQDSKKEDLLGAVSALELEPDEQSRIARFCTNTLRITRQYVSEPTDYCFPGLPTREFYDAIDAPWLRTLEDATDAIADDFARVIASERVELVPYVQYPDGAPLRQWEALNHSPDWSAIHLLRNGARVEVNARHCEATLTVLKRLPQPAIDGVSPNAFFSLLGPGAYIPPHHGVANTRLICHLPLVVPEGCWFRVGAERREWQRGKAFMFDDTIEHEARNESDKLRVVFICDVWHPALTSRERAAVAALVAERERQNGNDRVGGGSG